MFTFGDPNKNGCGPWWVPQEWKDEYFSSECDLHDADYETDEITKRQSDKAFYLRMLAKISLETSWKTRQIRGFQARIYYYIVRYLGWTSHKNGLDT